MRPKLSVIMPCYNVSDTIDRAVRSIAMQQVNFEYEIIAIDDASTDETYAALQRLSAQLPALRILRNESNQGNAISFYRGLSEAQGDYFCVLDGDDYYTLPNKFQKQADFLDADVKQAYVGCCHYFVIDVGEGQVSVPDCVSFDEFNYTDFLTQHAGYFHTATHMYRHIFRGNVPEYYKQKIYRGDTPRTVFHLMFSGGRIKILNFVASAYVFTYEGIWSSMDQKKQYEYQINYLNHLDQTVNTPMEHACVAALREKNEKMLVDAPDEKRRYPEKSIEACLARMFRYAQIYAFREKDYFLKNVYSSEYLDTLCASLGVIYRIHHPECIQKAVQKKHLVILMWQLNPHGGGLFREITELLQIYADWQIKVVVTDRASDIGPAKDLWAALPQVELVKVPADCQDTLGFLSNILCDFQPEKLYDYCGHVDVYSSAAIQDGPCKNLCLYSYDHGFLTGLQNPFLHRIIAKRPADYTMLTHNFGEERILYIPTWNILDHAPSSLTYEPFAQHTKLITASGAARFYKLEGGWPYRYEDFIIALLKETGGIHYHIGDIPQERMEQLQRHMAEAGVEQDRLIHIPWVDHLAQFFLEKHVDVFIEPFPTVSYKMTLDLLAAGIPVIAFDAVKRMEMADFLYPQAFKWRSKEQFIDILTHLTPEELRNHSHWAKDYFQHNHSLALIAPCILGDTSLLIPEKVHLTDLNIIDIRTQERLYQDCSRFQIMSDTPISGNPNRPGTKPSAPPKEAPLTPKLPDKATETIKETPSAADDKALRARTEALRQSRTYKLGYGVTYWPRTLKLFLRLLPEKGFANAWKAAHQTDELTGRLITDAALELAYVESGICMRVGRFLTLPYRGMRALLSWLTGANRRARQAMLEEKLLKTEKMLQNFVRQSNQNQKEIKRSLYRIKTTLPRIEDEFLKYQDAQIPYQQENLEQSKCVSADTAYIKSAMRRYESMLKQTNQLVTEVKQTFPQMLSKTMPRQSIEHLDYHLTEHCNLNCKCCSTFSPLAKEKFADPDQFARDLTRLHELIGDRLEQLHLLGGEPLLHPQIEQFARLSREIFPEARIDFTTNGLLIHSMSESFWDTLRRYNVAIKYTKYPINLDYDEIVDYVRSKGVRIFSAGGEKPISQFRRIPLNAKGTYNTYLSYIQCPYTDCAQLRDGKLYRCPASAYSDLVNSALQAEGKTDRFNLTAQDAIDLWQVHDADEVLSFLTNAVPFCQYCDMANATTIPWCQSKKTVSEWVDQK